MSHRQMTKEEFDRYWIGKMDYHNHSIPKHVFCDLVQYVQRGVMPGMFIKSILSNDLRSCVSVSDAYSLRKIKEYVAYLVDCLPAICWGSKQTVEQWCKQGGYVEG